MTRVRIGIVSWNTAELLARCLTALPAAADGLDYEVVVVDNASEDDSVEVARRHGGVNVVVNEQNVGYARAMNTALRAHGLDEPCEVLIALNPDTEAPPGSLRTLVERLLSHAGVGLVAPQLLNADGSPQHSVYRFPSPFLTFVICTVPLRLQRGMLARRLWLEGRVAHDRACDIDWAIGAVHVVRAAALGRQDPYCERWFMYAEDMDLCWRLQEGGWRRRLEPDVQIVHVANAAGRQAWGETRTQRWWEATYDWYRFRRGVPAVRRYAAMNTVGVTKLLRLARLRRRLVRHGDAPVTPTRITELEEILPLHRAMLRAPDSTFVPERAGELLQDG